MNEQQPDNQESHVPELKAAAPTATAIAITSFVLGILAVISAAILLSGISLILVAGVCGIVGVIFAVVHLAKKYLPRTLALWGLGFSIAGILATTAIFLYGVKVMRQMQREETQVFSEWIDKAAPDFTVTDIDGKTFTLSQQRGKDVMVIFWATWCPPCKKEIPNLIKLRNIYSSANLAIIAISNEDNETLRIFRQTNGLNYTVASAESMPAPYGDVTGIPTVFFINKNGIIRDVTQGYHDFEELKSLVSAMDTTATPAK